MQPNDDNFRRTHRTPPPTRGGSFLPVLAVAAVAVVAVVAAVMVQRADNNEPREASLGAARTATAQSGEVIKAPALQAPSTRAMGGAPACKQCGVVEMVVAVSEPGRKQARGYQMHIRMDDGTLRTVEQRGALAAGSRVVVDGDTVKPLP